MVQHVLLTRTHIEQALKPERVRTILIIQTALMAGVLFFLSVILFTAQFSSARASISHEVSAVDLMSLVHGFITFMAFAASLFLSRSFLTPLRLNQPAPPATPEEAATRAIALFQTSVIMRLALLEGAAFFGLVVCLIGVQEGLMTLHPIYWLNTISTLLFLGTGVFTFPTRNRIIEMLEEKFVQ